jgi:hypothetical protein
MYGTVSVMNAGCTNAYIRILSIYETETSTSCIEPQ